MIFSKLLSRRFISKLLLACTVVSFVTACAYTKETLDLDTDLALNFHISSVVNPDSDGRTSPIVLNVLYLKDKRQFEQEDFIALLEDTEGRLGKDLIEKIRLKEFIPAENRIFEKVLPQGVNYVGIVAEYIQYQDAIGKLVVPIAPHSDNYFEIGVEKASLTLKD